MPSSSTVLPSTAAPRFHCTSASHAALRASPLWKFMPFVGYQPMYDDARPLLVLEMRNCSACHSSLCVEVELQEAA